MGKKKIDKETDNGAFEIAFRDGNLGLNPEQIMPLFKALIKQHNEMVDLVNKLEYQVTKLRERNKIEPKTR